MKNKRKDFIAKLTGAINAHINHFSLVAFADEPPAGGQKSNEPPQNNNLPPVNYDDLVRRARQEEKDKLYPEIQRLKTEVTTITNMNNTNMLEKAKLQNKVEELEKKIKDGNSEEVKTLNAKIEVLQKENDELKKKAPNEEELRKKIAGEYEVKDYLKDQLAEHGDEILTSFKDEVKGTTKEEVDASLKKAIEKSDAIREELGIKKDPKKDDKGKDDKSGKGEKGEKPKKPPVHNPSGGNAEDEKLLDADYISKLDPTSKEYAEWRKKAGIK